MTKFVLDMGNSAIDGTATEGQRSGLANKGKTATFIEGRHEHGWQKAFNRMRSGNLRTLGADDKLYVHKHGEAGEPLVGIELDGDNKFYSPDDLARMLDKEGLTKSFRDLRMFACESADQGTKGQETTPAFASLLADAMRRRGNNRIRVSGYHENVVSTYRPRKDPNGGVTAQSHKGTHINNGELENYYRASLYRQSF